MGKKTKNKLSNCNSSVPLVMSSKYNILDPIVEDIYNDCVKLNEEETTALKERYKIVIEKYVDIMKEVDPTFKDIFNGINYIGSFYDGSRITEATEFDLNLVLKPNFEVKLIRKRRPAGFASMKVDRSSTLPLPEACKDWINDKGFLNPNAVRWWLQSVVTKTLKKLEEEKLIHGCKLRLHQSGPAWTLSVTSQVPPSKTIDIDLVPVLEFPTSRELIILPLRKENICKKLDFTKIREQLAKEGWQKNAKLIVKPRKSSLALDHQRFTLQKTLLPADSSRKTVCFTLKPWFAVPKPPAINCPCHMCISWRMSFPLHESAMIKDLQWFKYTLRLVKKVRDALDLHEVASYYIKTLFLLELLKNGPERWTSSRRGHLFIYMLNCLINALENGRILFVWNQNCNLIGNVNKDRLRNSANRLQRFCDRIDNLVEKKDEEQLKSMMQSLLNPPQDNL